MIPLAVFVPLLFLYSLLSGRLERTIVTAPIVFAVAGMLMFPHPFRGRVNRTD
jgi:sodium/hydrogen antiporter